MLFPPTPGVFRNQKEGICPSVVDTHNFLIFSSPSVTYLLVTGDTTSVAGLTNHLHVVVVASLLTEGEEPVAPGPPMTSLMFTSSF